MRCSTCHVPMDATPTGQRCPSCGAGPKARASRAKGHRRTRAYQQRAKVHALRMARCRLTRLSAMSFEDAREAYLTDERYYLAFRTMSRESRRLRSLAGLDGAA